MPVVTRVQFTATSLAGLFDVSVEVVHGLARRGIVVREGRNSYALAPSVRNYVRHLREAAAGRGNGTEPTEQSIARARLAKAQADAAELKNAQRRGDLVPASEVEQEWSGALRVVRAGIMRLPRRAGDRLALTAAQVRGLDEECRACLTEISCDDKPC
jgi:phage terminase Nu1 subunit (DNA packaging protein)